MKSVISLIRQLARKLHSSPPGSHKAFLFYEPISRKKKTSSRMAEIVLKNLSKHFGGLTALNNLSLDIPDGRAVVLLGPSGCGKTTLLRCIAGLEKPDSGSVLIDGNLVNDLTPRERDLSMVFQNYALFPLMSAYDNIAFPLKIRGKSQSEISARVKEVAKLLQIENLLTKMPRQLSGGEQQRVAIGRAIAREPKAFLLDEPLSNMDAPTRVQLRTELKKIQRNLSVTTIYVTHDQSEAMALADRIGVMKSGEVLQYNSPDEVYTNPATTFVASFIGSPPTNLADVELVRDSSNSYLKGRGISYLLSPDSTVRIAQNSPSAQFVLGVRSEDILVTKDGPSKFAQAEVQLVESFGAFVLLELKISDGMYFKVSVARDSRFVSGDRVYLEIVNSRFHLFERSTGKAVI
jgi:multiple sugar transport system ATP-binding protein